MNNYLTLLREQSLVAKFTELIDFKFQMLV